MKKQVRSINLFGSVTAWSIILTLFLSVAPNLGEMLDSDKVKPSDIINILAVLASSTLSIIAAYSENTAGTQITTPKFLPGRNKED